MISRILIFIIIFLIPLYSFSGELNLKSEKVYWWEKIPPPKARNGKQMPENWWTWIKRSSKKWNVNPFHIAALIDVECNGFDKPGGLPIKKGSKYISPCGFNRYNRIPPEIIWNPEKQIDRCAQLLRGDLQKRLKKYNKEYTRTYGLSIYNNSKRMEKEARKAYVKK